MIHGMSHKTSYRTSGREALTEKDVQTRMFLTEVTCVSCDRIFYSILPAGAIVRHSCGAVGELWARGSRGMLMSRNLGRLQAPEDSGELRYNGTHHPECRCNYTKMSTGDLHCAWIGPVPVIQAEYE